MNKSFLLSYRSIGCCCRVPCTGMSLCPSPVLLPKTHYTMPPILELPSLSPSHWVHHQVHSKLYCFLTKEFSQAGDRHTTLWAILILLLILPDYGICPRWISLRSSYHCLLWPYPHPLVVYASPHQFHKPYPLILVSSFVWLYYSLPDLSLWLGKLKWAK